MEHVLQRGPVLGNWGENSGACPPEVPRTRELAGKQWSMSSRGVPYWGTGGQTVEHVLQRCPIPQNWRANSGACPPEVPYIQNWWANSGACPPEVPYTTELVGKQWSMSSRGALYYRTGGQTVEHVLQRCPVLGNWWANSGACPPEVPYTTELVGKQWSMSSRGVPYWGTGGQTVEHVLQRCPIPQNWRANSGACPPEVSRTGELVGKQWSMSSRGALYYRTGGQTVEHVLQRCPVLQNWWANSGACPPEESRTGELVGKQWSMSSRGALYYRTGGQTVEHVLQRCPVLQNWWANSGACPPEVPYTSELVGKQWNMSTRGVPYWGTGGQTVEHVLQRCPIPQNWWANSGACPPEVPRTSGPTSRCTTDGHHAAHRTVWLPEGTRESGPVDPDMPV